MYNSERRRSSYLVPILIGAAVSNTFFNLYNGHRADEAEDLVDHVQAYNEQVHTQLAPKYPSMEDLVLHHDGKTITFHTRTEQGIAQNCSGEYEVKAEQATAIGEIACTQTDKIG